MFLYANANATNIEMSARRDSDLFVGIGSKLYRYRFKWRRGWKSPRKSVHTIFTCLRESYLPVFSIWLVPTDSLVPIEKSVFDMTSFCCVDRQFISLAFGQCHAVQILCLTIYVNVYIYVSTTKYLLVMVIRFDIMLILYASKQALFWFWNNNYYIEIYICK